MSALAQEIHRWTRDEYERLVENGTFGPEDRVELVEGIIYDMTPQNSRHAAVIGRLTKVLAALYAEDGSVRVQTPLALGEDSLPEPDLAVVPGDDFDYFDSHPTTAWLVIEVSDSSASRDRETKANLYSRAGIPEYWIVNVSEKVLEVFREPSLGGYRSKAVLRASDSVSPLSRPHVSLPVRRILP
jgi:Uma2 family endonuclease